MKNVLQSIGVVLLGLIVPTILARVTDTGLETSGVFPSVEYQKEHGFNVLWMDMLALAYRFGFTMFGGFIAAKLAPSRPMRLVIILGVVTTVVAIVGNIVVANMPETANVLPIWFSIVSVITAFPAVWLGGKLCMDRLGKK